MFSWDEIRRHKTLSEGVWVTHGANVYDVTNFVQGHPGGTSWSWCSSGTKMLTVQAGAHLGGEKAVERLR